MTISTIPGRKGPNDIIIMYNELPISLREIADILLLLWDNEDELYPPPAKGSQFSLDFINDLYKERKVTDDLLKKYHLKK